MPEMDKHDKKKKTICCCCCWCFSVFFVSLLAVIGISMRSCFGFHLNIEYTRVHIKCKETEYSKYEVFLPFDACVCASSSSASSYVDVERGGENEWCRFLFSFFRLTPFFLSFVSLHHSSFYVHNQVIKILFIHKIVCVCVYVSNLWTNMGISLVLFGNVRFCSNFTVNWHMERIWYAIKFCTHKSSKKVCRKRKMKNALGASSNEMRVQSQ